MKNYLFQGIFAGKSFFPVFFTGCFLLFIFSSGFSQNAQTGETIFNQKCTACHTIGEGNLVGPDLKNIALERDREWLTRFILKPEQLISDGDSLANALLRQFNNIPMPNQGLTESEVESIMLYLEQKNSAEAPASEKVEAVAETIQTKQAAAELSGDPDIGKELFTGTKSLQNGGPGCIGCHSIGGLPFSGGATLGPDLSIAVDKYGRQGLKSVITNIAFPTMLPLYQNKPLTESEVQDLLAYIQLNQTSQPASLAGMSVIWLSLFAAIFFVIVVQIIWRNRLNPAEWELKTRKLTKEEA